MDFDKLQKSLKHLELQYQNLIGLEERKELKALDRDAIKESVIQRFETCYDTLWKHLKRYLLEELGLPETPNSPKGIFRLAYENQLLRELESWFDYAQARIDTAHDYNLEKVESALEQIEPFIDDAIGVYQTLTKSTWE